MIAELEFFVAPLFVPSRDKWAVVSYVVIDEDVIILVIVIVIDIDGCIVIVDVVGVIVIVMTMIIGVIVVVFADKVFRDLLFAFIFTLLMKFLVWKQGA